MSFFTKTIGLFLFSTQMVFAAVNINTADSTALQAFNGVGPSTAQKIVDYRTANGNFASCLDLKNIKGIGPATLEKIKPDCTVGEAKKEQKKK